MQPLNTLPLFQTDSSTPPHEAGELRPASSWLAVHLPNLPLEALPNDARTPTVVAEAVRGQWRVIAANRRAAKLGIVPELPLAAAFALVHSLNVLSRSRAAEQAVLESLAEWAYSISPLVCIESETELALEVARSLKLFEGLEAIKTLVADELTRRGLSFHLAAAPTVAAAVWLARARQPDALAAESLGARLGALPLTVARWPRAVQALLEDIGVRTLADCLRLPRDGLARRIGRERVRELDRALGREPALRAEWQPSQRFSERVELAAESTRCEMLVNAALVLIDRLVPLLRRRQAEVASLVLSFEHLHHARTDVCFDFVQPCHEREPLLALVRDRIERLTLPAPAIAVVLETGVLQPLSIEPAALFDGGCSTPPALGLVERLRERCGATGVFGIGLAHDHRPERAWRSIDRFGALRPNAEQGAAAAERPLWVLQKPLLLDSAAARTHYQAPLRLCSGPERVESGWWDGKDVDRDYYIAQAGQGQRLWVFRNRRDGTWYLHGLFG